MDRFPLPSSAGRYSYRRRFGSGEAGHRGTDIFAATGTPVVAVEAGQATRKTEPRGGRVVYLDGDSGARHFYGHLAFWSPKLQQLGTGRVQSGDQLGGVGNTGNAKGGPPHLHFQTKKSKSAPWYDPFDLLRKLDPRPAIERYVQKKTTLWVTTPLVVAVLLWLLSRDD